MHSENSNYNIAVRLLSRGELAKHAVNEARSLAVTN